MTTWADKINKSIPFPPDLYKMQIDGAGWDKTSTGKDRLTVRFLCLTGAGQGKFLKLKLIESDTPEGLAFFFDRLASLGVTADYLREHEPSQQEIADFIKASGGEWMVTTEMGEFLGRTQVEVVKVERA